MTDLAALDDAALLDALRALYAPGAPEPDLAALTAALRGRLLDVPVPGGAVRVDLGDWTSILLVRLGAWEPHLVRAARALVREGDVAVDAGAHAGTWTLLLCSLVGASGRVRAYEPHPVTAARARAAVAAAGFAARAQVIEAALGEREAVAPLYAAAASGRFAGADAMLRSLVLAEGYAAAGAARVRVTALDGDGLERVDFLKIDTEGAELAVLRGARGLLARSPDPRLLVELHVEELAAQGASTLDVVRELRGQGMTVLDLVPQGAALVGRPLGADEAPSSHHILARRADGAFSVSLV